jgi:hypothetical protein
MAKIDDDIPIPPSGAGGRKHATIFDQLEIGQSFLYEGAWESGRVAASKRNSLKRRYVTRMTPEGLRIWRVK